MFKAGQEIFHGFYNDFLGKSSPPRWEICVEYLKGGRINDPRMSGGIMEAAIGSMYVKRHSKEEAKKLTTEMSEVLR